MILLRPDCLAFESPDGGYIPCSAKQVVVELIGEAANWIDKDVIVHASEAVLHYFRQEKGKDSVSVGEFVEALERVLQGLGLDVKANVPPASLSASASNTAPGSIPAERQVIETDLLEMAGRSSGGAELFFFPLLRTAIRERLSGSPVVLRFHRLRDCVKLMIGVKRWNGACQSLNDQIVDYLRGCLTSEKCVSGCALVVS
jgi:hypothetical protein